MAFPGSSRARVTVVLALLICATAAHAAVFVKSDAPPGGDGSSWDSAFNRIQDGLAAATSTNNEVWVAEGAYYENVVLRTGIRLYGGFAGTETSLSQSDPAANVTTIDGGQNGNAVIGANSALIDGFTITNGKPYSTGGGIYCSYSSPTISNCRITANAGSGVYCYQSSPTIIDCEISLNADKGIYCDVGGNPTITDCTISDNSASQYAGIHCYSARPTIKRCIVTGNLATSGTARGGGMAFVSCSQAITVENCLIFDNRAAMGAGVYCSMSSPSFVNCTIAGNIATTSGGNIYLTGANPTFLNTIVASGGAPSAGAVYKSTTSDPTFSFCDFWDNGEDPFSPASWNPVAGGNNRAIDPVFVAPENGDYHLSSASLCIDAGTDEGAAADDLDGNPRPYGEKADIGAYEYTAAVYDSVVDVKRKCDGQPVVIRDAVVSGVFDGFFYIQQLDRTAGIRVVWSGPVSPSTRVTVTGTMETRDGIERQIRATDVDPGEPAEVEPLGMPSRSLVGSGFEYDPGPPASGQMGKAACIGPNNVGLLVRVWGRGVPSAGVGFGLDDLSGQTAAHVLTPNGLATGAEGRLVQVTGVCSLAADPSGLCAVILVRDSSDVVLLD